MDLIGSFAKQNKKVIKQNLKMKQKFCPTNRPSLTQYIKNVNQFLMVENKRQTILFAKKWRQNKKLEVTNSQEILKKYDKKQSITVDVKRTTNTNVKNKNYIK